METQVMVEVIVAERLEECEKMKANIRYHNEVFAKFKEQWSGHHIDNAKSMAQEKGLPFDLVLDGLVANHFNRCYAQVNT